MTTLFLCKVLVDHTPYMNRSEEYIRNHIVEANDQYEAEQLVGKYYDAISDQYGDIYHGYVQETTEMINADFIKKTVAKHNNA